MNNQHIHCTVDNCHYWKQGNMCDANEIVVVSDGFGEQQPDNIDATMARRFSPTPVQKCMDTCCKTFVQEGSNQIGADGVTKI